MDYGIMLTQSNRFTIVSPKKLSTVKNLLKIENKLCSQMCLLFVFIVIKILMSIILNSFMINFNIVLLTFLKTKY